MTHLDTANIESFTPIEEYTFSHLKDLNLEWYAVGASHTQTMIWGPYSSQLACKRIEFRLKFNWCANIRTVIIANGRWIATSDYNWILKELMGYPCDKCHKRSKRLFRYSSRVRAYGYCYFCYQEERRLHSHQCELCHAEFVDWNRNSRVDVWDKNVCLSCRSTHQYGLLKADHKRKLSTIHSNTRRTRKLQACTGFTSKEWDNCLGYWGFRCAVCNRPRGLWHTLAQDHWEALARGGGYTADNIVPLCHGVDGCNNSKGDKNAHTWLLERYSARKTAQIEKRIAAYFAWTKTGDTREVVSVR